MAQLCAACGGLWTSGSTICAHCQKSSSPIDAIHCPMCAELVARGALKCRWCGESIAAALPAPRPGYDVPPPPLPMAPDGTAALVVAIIGAVGAFAMCGIPVILGPVAWAMAGGVERRRAAMSLPPDGATTAAKVIGIILTILLILSILALAAFFALAFVGAAASHP